MTVILKSWPTVIFNFRRIPRRSLVSAPAFWFVIFWSVSLKKLKANYRPIAHCGFTRLMIRKFAVFSTYSACTRYAYFHVVICALSTKLNWNFFCLQPHYPPYAASLHFELYKKGGKFYMQFFYRNSSAEELMPLDVPLCGTMFSIEKFYAAYKTFIPTESFDQECSLPFYVNIIEGNFVWSSESKTKKLFEFIYEHSIEKKNVFFHRYRCCSCSRCDITTSHNHFVEVMVGKAWHHEYEIGKFEILVK